LPELEYLFKHVLAQETTYESILLQRRRELHARVGQAMEMLFADRLEEFYGVLAHHYVRAEAWAQALAYLLKAADQAGRMAADAEALAHYRQAISAYGRAFGEQWDPSSGQCWSARWGKLFSGGANMSKGSNTSGGRWLT
jgi:predicted ATPase